MSFRNRWPLGVASVAGLHLGTSGAFCSWGGPQTLHSLPPQQDCCEAQQWYLRMIPGLLLLKISLKFSPSRELKTILQYEELRGREYLKK